MGDRLESFEPIGVTLEEYLGGPESMRPAELVGGMVREPAAPRYGHQWRLTHLAALMDVHVRHERLGQVSVAPVDVVLDARAPLVVQPDIVFISAARLSIVRDRVFGAPDLVVEVLSPATAHRDAGTKLRWYEDYGVGEVWLVRLTKPSIDVVTFGPSAVARRRYTGDEVPSSGVLPSWPFGVSRIFE
jgi:Uma2 family endonuclease